MNFRVGLIVNCTIDEIVAEDQNGNTERIKAGTVVIATGLKSDGSLYDRIQGEVNEVYQIGDCIKPRNFIEAVHEAYEIAKMI